MSACVVVWRFRSEMVPGAQDSESYVGDNPASHCHILSKEHREKERKASTVVGFLLAGLALGALAGAGYTLGQREHPSTTLAGVVISILSLTFMFFLWWAKTKASIILNSSTLEKDAACSFGCIQLSLVLLVGSVLFSIFPSLWWVDSITTILICALILKEATETLYAVSRPDFDGCACGGEVRLGSIWLFRT